MIIVGASLVNEIGLVEAVSGDSTSSGYFLGDDPLLSILKNVDSLSSINITWLSFISSSSAFGPCSFIKFCFNSFSSSF
jgi:hypothetical protein